MWCCNVGFLLVWVQWSVCGCVGGFWIAVNDVVDALNSWVSLI